MTSGESSVAVSGAVEGILDEAVMRRLAADLGIHVGAVFGRSGKPQLRARIDGYNEAARFAPWLGCVDIPVSCHSERSEESKAVAALQA